MLDESCSDLCSGAWQAMQGLGWNTRLIKNARKDCRNDGGLARWFHENGVSGDEGRRRHSAKNGERKVPWCDDGSHTTSTVVVTDVLSRNAQPSIREPKHITCIIAAKVDRLADVGICLGPSLARLKDLQSREFKAALSQQFASTLKDFCSLLG